MSEKEVFVYLNIDGSEHPVGTLRFEQANGKELCSFEFCDSWLRTHPDFFLDPDLHPFPGRQYPPSDKPIFGVFADSSPDRWGQRLMQRREALQAAAEDRKPNRLLSSDYLLGVYDKTRMGALRFTDSNGVYLSSDTELATPPFASLRELEAASRALESASLEDEHTWLKKLVAPGSSLGGARPKANVQAPDGSIWIAKFPAKHDEEDKGAWEMVAHDLASLCGLNTPPAQLLKFSKAGSTFLVKRFDRTETGERTPFMSAMTALGETDGTSNAGYLDIAEKLSTFNPDNDADLKELWKRIVFNISISNTDDHLRNHGFIWNNGFWHLSPVYDVNPDIYGNFLSLFITEADNRLDYQLAVDVCDLFGLDVQEAQSTICSIAATVNNNWHILARKYGLSRDEIARHEPAFSLAHRKADICRTVEAKFVQLTDIGTDTHSDNERYPDAPSSNSDPDNR